jgi:hypothetical protein
MNTSIYDKTAKGKEEIATRKYQLAPRLRTLLVLIDGRRGEEELLRNVAGLGLGASALAELLEHGYIVLATSYVALAEDPLPAELSLAEPAPAPQVQAQQSAQAAQIAQFQSIYDFYNKTIKNTIGLRGFTLQLKVEKASSVAELRELRHPYIEAVQKARGSETAAALARQLDQLLGITPTV